MPRIPARSEGFTLLEIAVVLVIISLISAIGFGLVSSILQKSSVSTTRANADLVKQALSRYVATYSRFPCPALATLASSAANAGVEDANPGCTSTLVPTAPPNQIARGVVPWKTLGLTAEQAQDGFARMFRYHVTVSATATTSASIAAVQGNMTLHSGTPPALGPPALGNQINTCAVTPGADDSNACNLRAVIVLISHGPNGYGAPMPSGLSMPAPTSAPELANTDNDFAFVNSEPSANAALEFDDVVYAWSPADFIDPLAQQGAMKSALAITNEQLKALQSAIVNVIVRDMANPHQLKGTIAAYGFGTAPNDAWARPIVYGIDPALVNTNVCNAALNQTAFTLTSVGIDNVQGPNAVTGRTDDIVLTISADVIKNIINANGMPCP